ncbi:ATP-binding protein [Paraburkholderia fungorum]|uniref:ATP-binding protein n=1 Tax=Paraburkholderia fungorum TaxID=134537 RepID=UPI0038BB3FC3
MQMPRWHQLVIRPYNGGCEIRERCRTAHGSRPPGPSRQCRRRGEDSGGGIRESNLPRHFEPFFTTRGSSMGMGLAAFSSIVGAHRGQIRPMDEVRK